MDGHFNMQKWFHRVFFPAARTRTSKPVLLLIDNVSGHFAAFDRENVKCAFSA